MSNASTALLPVVPSVGSLALPPIQLSSPTAASNSLSEWRLSMNLARLKLEEEEGKVRDDVAARYTRVIVQTKMYWGCCCLKDYIDLQGRKYGV